MNIIYFDILKKIFDAGYTAYIVGGFVRDKLLHINSFDVDICTSATPKELLNLFGNNNVDVISEYGAIKLNLGNYHVDITTYRKDVKYVDGKPKELLYVKTLEEDLQRRDFTINTICLDKDANLIDLLDGKKDLNNKLIKTVGEAKIRFEEDPTRILRALRFMTSLKFKLDLEILEYLETNKETISKINYSKRKYELDKIFASKNMFDFFNIVKKYSLEDCLGIHFNKVIRTTSIIGIWAQLQTDLEYPFTKPEKEQIKNIKALVDKKTIDKYDAYKYGNYICVTAAQILNINVKKINKIYEKLPIKDIIDINIDSKTICEVMKIKPSKQLGDIYKILESEILEYKLVNKTESIKKRLESLREEQK